MSELILLIDKISLQRNPYFGVKNNEELTKTKALPQVSVENDTDTEILLAGGQYGLNELLLQLDQTIENRN